MVNRNFDDLSAAGHKGGNAPKHLWTDEEREIIRRDYQFNRKSRRDLALRLGVSENAVTGQIAAMGMCKLTGRRPWSIEEKKELEEIIGRFAPRTIAKRMGRSVNSIVVMAHKIGLSRRSRDGWFTAREVCMILGVDHHWLKKYIDNGELKVSYHTETKPQKSGGMYYISESNLKKFICEHAFRLQGRNVDLLFIVSLLSERINEGKTL